MSITIERHRHIEELRAELADCFNTAEWRQIAAELAEAVTERDRRREGAPPQ